MTQRTQVGARRGQLTAWASGQLIGRMIGNVMKLQVWRGKLSLALRITPIRFRDFGPSWLFCAFS
ncbi:MAG: hypothetical protein ACLPSF_09715 [Methylocella sp.]